MSCTLCGSGLNPLLIDRMVDAQNASGGWVVRKKAPKIYMEREMDLFREDLDDPKRKSFDRKNLILTGQEIFKRWTPERRLFVVKAFFKGSRLRFSPSTITRKKKDKDGKVIGETTIDTTFVRSRRRYPELWNIFFFLLGLSYIIDSANLDIRREGVRKDPEYRKLYSDFLGLFHDTIKSPLFMRLKKILAKNLPDSFSEKTPAQKLKYLTMRQPYGSDEQPIPLGINLRATRSTADVERDFFGDDLTKAAKRPRSYDMGKVSQIIARKRLRIPPGGKSGGKGYGRAKNLVEAYQMVFPNATAKQIEEYEEFVKSLEEKE